MIIGFGHVARSGKDTAAEALVDQLGFRRDAFADDLKRLALGADPIITWDTTTMRPVHLLELIALGWTEQQMKDTFPEYRRFHQKLGTEGGRETFGRTFWTDRVLGRALPDEGVVVPDVRYPEEAEAIQGAGGIVVRVDRPGYTASGHISETALAEWDGWDHVLLNDGDVAQLQHRAVMLAADVLGIIERPA